MKKFAVLALAVFGSVLPLAPSRAAEAPDPNAVVPDEDIVPKTGPRQLFSTQSGSFEWPAVMARKTISEKGADITKSAMNAEWRSVKDKHDPDGGQLLLGLTNRVARTGRQCLFVEFNHVTKPNASAVVSSDLLPVLPNQPYHVAIWGKVDKERPLTLAQRLPYLKLRIDWFTAGTEEEGPEQSGEPVWKVQPMPGSKHRKPLFTVTEWTEYFANVKSPEDAAFVKITWSWETLPEEGETDGIIYFDDATLFGDAPPKEDPFADVEKEEKTEAPKEGAAPAAPSAPAPATPAPAPATPPKSSSLPKDIEATPVR